MEDEDKILPDWLREFKMRNIPAEYLNKFKEDTLLKYENEIDRLTKKCNELRKYEGECYQLKLDLKHYEMMKEELKMKDIQIENLEKTISKLKKCESCTYGKRRNEICDDCDGSYSKWQIRSDL